MPTHSQDYSKLLSDVKWMNPFNKFVDYIRDETISTRNFPRFEDYSILARKLPFFLYDNSEFASSLKCKTAFTTGDAIYMDLEFFIKCLEVDEICKQRGHDHLANTVLFVLVHELAHCLNNDFSRMPNVNSNITNIAQDIANNLAIIFNLGIEIDVDLFEKHLGFGMYGVTKEEFFQFKNQSSETIALWMYKNGLEKLKQQQGNQQQGNQQQGNQQQGNQLNNLAQEAADILQSGSSHQANEIDSHVIDHNKVAQAAEEANLNPTTINRAGLHSRSQEETEAIEQLNKHRARQSALEMEAIHQSLSREEQAQTSAGTQGSYYKQKVKLGDEGKITWNVAISESFESGGSMSTQYTEEVLADEYYSNPSMFDGVFYTNNKNKGTGIYIVDTSGSMPKHFLNNLFTEGLASVDLANEDGFESLLIFPADTDVKGVYWELTEDNKDDVINEVMNYGGGGTDFTLPIRNALEQANELDFDVKAVVFGTDLDALPPNFGMIENALPEDSDMPPVIFITNKLDKSYRDNFEKGCDGYAQVFYYTDGLELDIQDIQDELDSMRENFNTHTSLSM
ncbi:vWA domain-containing protein [Candidatus Enterovibrio escicola]|uniref:hypothetical protein n=1 Tax=Candidatus Enterovibrio escicola TaxID=1927127 RepID=UPI001237FEF6|nr:hypothetical protein [Candidatus Enterovibrio escacola]